MKKGISTVIATVLMLIIVVALAGTAWVFLSGTFVRTVSNVLEVVDVVEGTVILRNVGRNEILLEKLKIYVDGIETGFISNKDSIPPGDSAMVYILNRIPEGVWHLDENVGTIVHDSSGNDYNGDLNDIPCFVNKSFYNGHWYEYIGKGCDALGDTPTWKFANNFCRSRGGYLVVISSSDENNFVRDLGSNNVWIGFFQDPDDLTDNNGIPEGCSVEPDGCWHWLPDEASTYNNWAPGYPNYNPENCGEMRTDGKYNDLWCGIVRDFVCEYLVDPGNFDTTDELPQWVSGKFERALSFDGIDDYVELVGTDPKLDNTDFTICLWLKPEVQSERSRFVYFKWRPNLVLSSNNQNWGFELQDDAGYKPVSITQLIENKWYFACQRVIQQSSPGAYDGEHKAFLFLDDGTLKTASRNDIGYVTGSDGFHLRLSHIGWMGLPGNAYYKGLIDDFRVYTRALKDEEIERLYRKGPIKRKNVQIVGMGNAITIPIDFEEDNPIGISEWYRRTGKNTGKGINLCGWTCEDWVNKAPNKTWEFGRYASPASSDWNSPPSQDSGFITCCHYEDPAQNCGGCEVTTWFKKYLIVPTTANRVWLRYSTDESIRIYVNGNLFHQRGCCCNPCSDLDLTPAIVKGKGNWITVKFTESCGCGYFGGNVWYD